MKRMRRPHSINQIEMRLLQGQLPFSEAETVDVARAAKILGGLQPVDEYVVYRLLRLPKGHGLIGYQTSRYAPWHIYYESIVDFLEAVRVRHGLPDRKPPLVLGRYRDEDLLPLDPHDIISSGEASSLMNLHRSKVIQRIESGAIKAYRLSAGHENISSIPWCISHESVRQYVATYRLSFAESVRVPVRGL